MDLKEALLEDHSKSQIMRIVNHIGHDKKRFSLLMELFLGKDARLSQRASWAVSYCAEANPTFIIPYLEAMVANLENPVHNAVKRNTIRILAEVEIPETLLGTVADICFRFLDDPQEAIATRVFSMSVCFNITKREPELANELRLIIEDHYPHGSAGFKSRARRVLKELSKLT